MELNLQYMKGGMFTNKSYFGYTNTVLKSALCKYFRRNEIEKFTFALDELSLFALLPNSDALVTNTLNRLKILIIEDMSYIHTSRVELVLDQINRFKIASDIIHIHNIASIVSDASKNRLISYLKAWYNTMSIINKQHIIDADIKIDNTYYIKGDSKLLLKVGLLFETLLKEKDEECLTYVMFLVNNEDIECGTRYRRKYPSLLIFQILERYVKKSLFEFALNQYFRKDMKERIMYIIWLCLLVIKKDNIIEEIITIPIININDHMKNRTNIKIDSYVLEDYHVSKEYSIEKFAKEGAYVVNETHEGFSKERFDELKEFYIESKNPKIEDTKEIIETMTFDQFKIIKIITEGVVGGKVPCIIIEYNNKRYVIKEMRPSFNEGRDYMFVDSIKHIFGLNNLDMKRIILDKSFNSQKELIYKKAYFCMMTYIPNKNSVVQNKELFTPNNPLSKELIKIVLFKILFNVSDNCTRNILVSSDNRLYSIDENDIFGKRTALFANNCFSLKVNSKDEIMKIADNVYKTALDNYEIIIKNLVKYGFEDKVTLFKDRLDNFIKIIS